MAESTLSLNWSDLLNDVGFYLGWGRETSPGTAVDTDNLTKWTTEQYERINGAVKVGLRQLYYPPALKDDVPAHSWTYLTPTTSITTWLTFTGTLTQTFENINNTTTVTDSSAPFFPSVIGHNMVSSIDGSSGSYKIVAYVSSSMVIVAGAVAAGDVRMTYTVTADGYYRLSDDYGGLLGPITFESNAGTWSPIPLASESQVRLLLQGITGDGRPRYAAVRPVKSDGTTGQRFDLCLYPIPETDYELFFQYQVNPEALTSTIVYPFGGMPHAETVRASCLAAAEQTENDERGPKWGYFIERLRASIDHDIRASTPENLGYNHDLSDYQGGRGQPWRYWDRSGYTASYTNTRTGVSYP